MNKRLSDLPFPADSNAARPPRRPGRPGLVATLLGVGAAAAAVVASQAGCATPGPGRRLNGASPPGAPAPTASQAVIDRIDPEANPPEPAAPRLPGCLEIPATYRLMLLNGHLTLVRETDAAPLPAGTAALRIVTGEIARGELAYQPALLPQELAAEVAAARTRTAQLDEALATVMERSRLLSEQAREIADENRRLSALLATAGTGISPVQARPIPAAESVPAAAGPSSEASPAAVPPADGGNDLEQ